MMRAALGCGVYLGFFAACIMFATILDARERAERRASLPQRRR